MVRMARRKKAMASAVADRHAADLAGRLGASLKDARTSPGLTQKVADVGESVRDFDRRLAALERHAIAKMRTDEVPRASGCCVLRATRRNRQLVAEHSAFFRSRFPGKGRAWIDALTTPEAAMPTAPA